MVARFITIYVDAGCMGGFGGGGDLAGGALCHGDFAGGGGAGDVTAQVPVVQVLAAGLGAARLRGMSSPGCSAGKSFIVP